MYIYIYIYTYIYIHIYIHVYIYIYNTCTLYAGSRCGKRPLETFCTTAEALCLLSPSFSASEKEMNRPSHAQKRPKYAQKSFTPPPLLISYIRLVKGGRSIYVCVYVRMHVCMSYVIQMRKKLNIQQKVPGYGS